VKFSFKTLTAVAGMSLSLAFFGGCTSEEPAAPPAPAASTPAPPPKASTPAPAATTPEPAPPVEHIEKDAPKPAPTPAPTPAPKDAPKK
jgi:hypothetical protein